MKQRHLAWAALTLGVVTTLWLGGCTSSKHEEQAKAQPTTRLSEQAEPAGATLPPSNGGYGYRPYTGNYNDWRY